MQNLEIVLCQKEWIPYAAVLAGRLWPHDALPELERELFLLEESHRGVIFLARQRENWIGYAQCQLRFDYVEGTGTSPVGYLEGIYVEPAYRRQGVARSLLEACEAWAQTQGCTEFASDTEVSNSESRKFHKNTGFEEAAEIVHFRKKLGNG